MKAHKLMIMILAAAFMTAVSADLIVDGTTMPSTAIQSISIDPSTGDITVTSNGDWSVVDNGGTGGGGGGGGLVLPTITLSANPSAIFEGETTTLTWTISNAETCSTSGGTGAWPNTNPGTTGGSVAITINTAGSYTFTLTCTNADGTRNRSTTVSVSEQSSTNCSIPSSQYVVVPWEQQFSGKTWPAPNISPSTLTSSDSQLSVSSARATALQFNTGTAGGATWGSFSNAPTLGDNEAREYVLSQCPGEFTVPDGQERCYKRWGSGQMYWGLAGSGQSGCQLEPNTTYYLNVRFPNGCGGKASCKTLLGNFSNQ